MTKKWIVKEGVPENINNNLINYPELTRALLFYRGIENQDEAEKFLNLNYERDLHDPFLMLGMEKAVERILRAIKENKKIVMFGDYDADGISGCVIFYTFFKKIGFENFHIHIPDRYTQGYGLTLDAIDEFAKMKADLIVTVDCGITDVVETEKANGFGIDVIILDHHLPQENIPDAYAILDAKQEGDDYPFKYLSGAGVAFKTVTALIKRGDFDIVAGWEKWLLELTAIATVADMVPIRDENRAIVYFGLKVLRKTKRVGLLTLFKKLKLQILHLNEDDIGFMIAPRINIASRMDHATTSFNLLTTGDVGESEWIVSHLNGKNMERKEVVQVILDELEEKIGASGNKTPDVIVSGNREWLPGVLGLAANRILEKYNCPVFLWGQKGSQNIKGSCRSDGSIDLVKFMGTVPELFLESGGHKLAGGFSVLPESADLIEEKIKKAFDKVERAENGPVSIEIDKKMLIDDIIPAVWKVIKQFAPLGMDNPKPIFLFENVEISQIKEFGNGGVHLELGFKKTNNGIVKAIGFFMHQDDFKDIEIKSGDRLDLAASLEESHFRGVAELRLRIVDIRVAS